MTLTCDLEKIAYNLKTTGHILMQLYMINLMMYPTWFCKSNESGHVWCWPL